MTAELIPLGNDYDRQIARRVKLAIFDSGKTQKEVGAAAGIDPSSMTYRMQGTRPWRAFELALIAQATGVEVTDLLPRLDSNQQPFGYARDYRSNANRTYVDTRSGFYDDPAPECPCEYCRPRNVVDLAAYRRRAS